MNKETILELQKALEELLAQAGESKDYSQSESIDGPLCDCFTCNDLGNDSELVYTPIEELITNKINKHIKDGTFPTLNEAQAIHILDSINSKYN